MRAKAIATPGLAVFASYGKVNYSAQRFSRRTQFYVNCQPASIAELELLLCAEYREVNGEAVIPDAFPEERIPTEVPLKVGERRSVTRGQKDFDRKVADGSKPYLPPVVNTVEQMKGLAPGTYTLTGEASVYYMNKQLEQTLVSQVRAQARRSQAAHHYRTELGAIRYSSALFREMLNITQRHDAHVTITGLKGDIAVKVWPKRPAVATRLRKLVKLYKDTKHFVRAPI
jgi:hypothetical protein